MNNVVILFSFLFFLSSFNTSNNNNNNESQHCDIENGKRVKKFAFLWKYKNKTSMNSLLLYVNQWAVILFFNINCVVSIIAKLFVISHTKWGRYSHMAIQYNNHHWFLKHYSVVTPLILGHTHHIIYHY